jgi:fluoride exporter
VSAAVWAGVAGLGGAGALARFLLDGAISSRLRSPFPAGTFAINITGALLLGLLTGLAATGETLVLAGTAALGSCTTFSTWIFESQRLTEDAYARAALLNVIASLAAGLGAAALGRLIGAHL